MPNKVKVTTEEKVRIVELYLSGKIGYSEAGQKLGVDRKAIALWVSLFQSEGPEGLLPQAYDRAYSKETKLSAVLDYLAGKGALQEICKKYKIRSTYQLRDWLKVYNRHEDFTTHTGGSHMTKGRDTTAEERIKIAKECISNENDYGGTALRYQVSYQQVYIWAKKYREMGEPGLEDRRGHRAGTLPGRTLEEDLRGRISQLEREKYDLEMENSILKKVKELERRRR